MMRSEGLSALESTERAMKTEPSEVASEPTRTVVQASVAPETKAAASAAATILSFISTLSK